MADQTLTQFLSHEPPMLLLDTLVSVDAEGSCCKVTVTEEMPFVDSEGNLPSWVGIELMAQAIAVWGGWQSQHEGREVNIGLLLGSRKYETRVALFPKGSSLLVKTKKVLRDGNLGVFDCSINLAGELVGTAQVITYLPNEEELKKILAR